MFVLLTTWLSSRDNLATAGIERVTLWSRLNQGINYTSTTAHDELTHLKLDSHDFQAWNGDLVDVQDFEFVAQRLHRPLDETTLRRFWRKINDAKDVSAPTIA